jgi:hypothetical protein
VDISGAVKKGDNRVEIEVVNSWTNRFIGESTLPNAERVVKPLFDSWTISSKLQDAGLLFQLRIKN